MKKSNIELINAVFKLPIEYNKKKRELNENIITDLELRETIDDEAEPLYKFAFQPKTEFGKTVMRQFPRHYTTDVKYLKDTQKILKKYKGIDGEIFRPDFDNIMGLWDEIKNDTGFKERYNYLDWSYWEYLNKSDLFLQVMSLYSLSSPIISFFVPVIILIIPFFIIQMKGITLSLEQYIDVLKKIAENHAIGKLFTQFNDVDMNQKAYMIVSALFYLFSIYQNILSCYRFYTNMQKIHCHLTDVKQYIEYTHESIKNLLSVTDNYLSYKDFNDKLRDTDMKLMRYKVDLDKITPFQLSISKITQFGHILKTFYDLYSNEEYNDAFLHSFGFNGYIDNIEGLIININDRKINMTKFKNDKNGKKIKKNAKCDTTKKNKCILKDSYYPSLIDKQPISNTIELTSNTIITGPNASGKTTTLKSSLVNVILSQQIGCGFFSQAEMTPFHNIHCYLNIPDTSGRDSLFQAEARRCKEIIDSIHANKNESHFCVFDELYSGTNPDEAVESAESFMKYISKYSGVHCILTTHFMELCKNLENEPNFVNLHMQTTPTSDNGFTYMYTIKPGISNIKGGFKVLQDMNYPEEIIKNNMEKKTHIKEASITCEENEIRLESSL